MAKKKPTASSQRVVISIIYIFMGAGSLLSAFDMIKALFSGVMPETTAILTVTAGVIMFLAGFFGLFKLEKTARIWMGILIFAVSLINLIFAVFSGNFYTIGTTLMQAAVAWLYIVCN